MRTAVFKDRIIFQADYLDFKNILKLYAGIFYAREQMLSDSELLLTECLMVLDLPTEILKSAALVAFDEEYTWQNILGLCSSRGFEIEAEEGRTGEAV